MVKQFLKIAGVKTQSEFYKKYPTEAAFFRAHPEAKQLVHQKMAYGGMYAYPEGGPTGQDLNNIGGPSIPIPNPGMQDMLWGTPPSLGMAPAQLPMAMPPAPLKNYEGVSVWDMLSAQGKSGDFATRKELAKTLGIANYTGNKDQNKLMMDLIKQNPQVLEGISAGSSAAPRKRRASKPVATPQEDEIQLTDADYAAYNDAQAAANPFIMAPGQPAVNAPKGLKDYLPQLGGGTGAKSKQGMSTSGKVALGTGIALGTGVAAGAFGEIKDLMKRVNKGEYLNGQAKAKVTAYRNQFRNQMLKEAGTNIKNQQKWFSKLPAEQQSILKNLDLMEIPGDMHLMPHGTASRDLYTRDMLNEANAENILTNTNDALRESEEEAKIIRSNNAKKAAAARWGSKTQKVAEAEKALGMGDKFIGGLKAIGKSKYIAPVADLAKGFFQTFREEGGEQNPYSGTYSNGVYFEGGGPFDPRKAITPWNNPMNNPNYFSNYDANFSANNPVPKQPIGGAKPIYDVHGRPIPKQPIAGATPPVYDASGRAMPKRVMTYEEQIRRAIPPGAKKIPGITQSEGLGTRLFEGAKSAIEGNKYLRGLAQGAEGFFKMFREDGGDIYASGGSFVPDYAMMSAGQLPQYGYGKAMYGAGMAYGGPAYSDMTQYNHQGYVPAFDWMQDGGSPLYSTQGQTLRNFTNTLGYTQSGWSPTHMTLPNVGGASNMYARGGQKSSGAKDQQLLQGVAQMLQQGAKPEEVLQELVQAKVPQKKAVAIIQNVMQQMGGADAATPNQQQMVDPSQMAAYGGSYAKGGEYDMSEDEVQDLINQGYKIEYV